ncbi:MAG: hypothetical protein ACRDZ4_09645 [Egibacteraceae bacterium]
MGDHRPRLGQKPGPGGSPLGGARHRTSRRRQHRLLRVPGGGCCQPGTVLSIDPIDVGGLTPGHARVVPDVTDPAAR